MTNWYGTLRTILAGLQTRVRYESRLPSDQNAVDLFTGEWASAMPPGTVQTGGSFQAFDDPRIIDVADFIGGVAGKQVLELGPLEGGHSLLLERLGAAGVMAIEANPRAYLKCLITKEVNRLQRCRFLLGDFVEYLRTGGARYDICIASGVLYHMTNPAELLFLIARACDSAVIWTHYYDEDEIRASGRNAHRITAPERMEHEGFTYTAYRQNYGASLFRRGFCGGPNRYSYWMPRAEILRALEFFGFTAMETGFHEPLHRNGPAFLVTCRK